MLITATQIHDGKNWLPNGSVLDVAENGKVNAILDSSHQEQAKHYDGIICPGFVNAHCHLELSHMKGAIDKHTGLIPFLKQVAQTRNNYTEEQKTIARHEAFHTMLSNGIVAVGDIANTSDTLDLRVQNKIHFHSFVEALGFTPTPSRQFDYAVAVYHALAAQQQEEQTLQQSIVPHAPYSVSQQLFEFIDEFDTQSLISVHNQESKEEDEYYQSKKGGVTDLLSSLEIDDNFFSPSGNSSLQTYLHWLSKEHPIIFVHNTYTHKDDIAFAQNYAENAYWCICPNANLYIENRLPNITMLQESCNTICIGTDSLSSNDKLCVLSELNTIKNHHPEIEWEELLRWGTYNGASALQMSDAVGSISVGQQPGLLLLNKDYQLNTILY